MTSKNSKKMETTSLSEGGAMLNSKVQHIVMRRHLDLRRGMLAVPPAPGTAHQSSHSPLATKRARASPPKLPAPSTTAPRPHTTDSPALFQGPVSAPSRPHSSPWPHLVLISPPNRNPILSLRPPLFALRLPPLSAPRTLTMSPSRLTSPKKSCPTSDLP